VLDDRGDAIAHRVAPAESEVERVRHEQSQSVAGMLAKNLAIEVRRALDVADEPLARRGRVPALALVRIGVALDRGDRLFERRRRPVAAAEHERRGAQRVSGRK
jgi:hypothetical protein